MCADNASFWYSNTIRSLFPTEIVLMVKPCVVNDAQILFPLNRVKIKKHVQMHTVGV
jgi:hypothetical protein